MASAPVVGVELDDPTGDHDGSVGSSAFFQCTAGHGVLVPPSAVTLDEEPMGFGDDYIDVVEDKTASKNVKATKKNAKAAKKDTKTVVQNDYLKI